MKALEDPGLRSAAVEALAPVGRDDVGDALVQVALSSADADARAVAAELLRSWARAVPALLRGGATSDRTRLFEALGRLDAGGTTAALVAALEDSELGGIAAEVLATRGHDAAGAERVVAALGSTRARLRERASRVLEAWGPEALTIALGLAADGARRSDQAQTRRVLGDALRAIGAERCASHVAELWRRAAGDPTERKEAAETLRLLDPAAAAPIVSAVVAAIQSTSCAAPLDYSTLMLVTERAPSAAGPLLARAVRDPTLCHYAGPQLRALGTDAIARAVPDLLLAARGREPEPRGPALTLLAQLGHPDTAAIASAVLGDRTSRELARRGAARILGELGQAARPSLPALVQALDEPAPSLRQDVIAALGRLGTVVDDAVPELVVRLQDPAVATDVALLLARLGRALDEAAPVLALALTNDPDEERRVSAARAFGGLPDAPAAVGVAALSQAVERDASQRVRRAAIEALGALGSLAASARPVLEAKARDEHEPAWLRSEAAQAAAAVQAPRRPRRSAPPQPPPVTPERPRGWLGVQLRPERVVLPDGRAVQGAAIVDVVVGGPAAASGLAAGDVIVAFDGNELGGVPDVQARVASAGAGSSVRVGVLRRSGEGPPRRVDVVVTLGARERP